MGAWKWLKRVRGDGAGNEQCKDEGGDEGVKEEGEEDGGQAAL